MSKSKNNSLQFWAQNKVFGLFVFNLIVMLLIVLRSAGYFTPFFPITINFIVITSLILAIFLLNIKSSTLFIIALIFWILAGVLRVMSIEVWAIRAAIYTYEALTLGIFLMFFERIRRRKRNRKPNNY